jgi:hypothetical protein
VSKSFHYQLLKKLQTTQELTNQEYAYKPSRPCAVILFYVMSSIFIEWMKEAITELSFAKRETIHQSSNSSIIANASNSSSILNDYSSPLPAMDRQDENR